MTYARRTDRTQQSIINVLIKAGFSVHDTSRVGGGFPDLVVGIGGHTFLIECKDVEADWKYTPKQIKFRRTWEGHVYTLESPQMAIDWAITTRKRIQEKCK